MKSPIQRKYKIISPGDYSELIPKGDQKVFDSLEECLFTNIDSNQDIIPIIEHDDSYFLVWDELMDNKGNYINNRYYYEKFPRDGFIIPKTGDNLITNNDYPTPAFNIYHLKEDIINNGSILPITEIRFPNYKYGYRGICVRVKLPSYPCGIVIPWDKVSDPSLFSVSHENN